MRPPSWLRRSRSKFIFVKDLSIPPPESIARCKNRWSGDEWNRFLEDMRNQNTDLVERLRRRGSWKGMDRQERNFMEAGVVEITQRGRIDASWRREAMVCLLWTLGCTSNPLAVGQPADPKLSNRLPADFVETLVGNAVLRSHDSIERQCDVAELWHWRSRTRCLQESGHKLAISEDMAFEKIIRLASPRAAADGDMPAPIGDDFPAFGKAHRDLINERYSPATSVAQERHRHSTGSVDLPQAVVGPKHLPIPET